MNTKKKLTSITRVLKHHFKEIFIFCAVIFSCFTLYQFGYHQGFEQGAFSWRDMKKENLTLAQISQQCYQELGLKNQSNIELEQDKAIQQHTFDGVMATLNHLQKTNSKLKEENDLYRKILTPEEQQAGIQINSVQIFPLKQPGKFRYEILLVKFTHHNKMTPGEMQLNLQGIQDDEVIQLPFEVLNSQWAKGQPYEVRYFQTLQGEIQLPLGFIPESIQISLKNKGKGTQKPIQDEFPWLVSIV